MKRLIGLVVVGLLAASLLAGCGGSNGETALETVGEGISTEGKPVFYEFFTQG